MCVNVLLGAYPAYLTGDAAAGVGECVNYNTIVVSTKVTIRGICVEITTKGAGQIVGSEVK